MTGYGESARETLRSLTLYSSSRREVMDSYNGGEPGGRGTVQCRSVGIPLNAEVVAHAARLILDGNPR